MMYTLCTDDWKIVDIYSQLNASQQYTTIKQDQLSFNKPQRYKLFSNNLQ